MNKKGQYIPGGPMSQMPRLNAKVSPILILGIVIYVATFFNLVVKINIPNWVATIGLTIIFIGIIHSILMAIGIGN